uniref:EAL domain-containing protein n=1 Tax=Candidatus Enterococcus willemsii TaxID=1857215 RepID=UPI00403F91C4
MANSAHFSHDSTLECNQLCSLVNLSPILTFILNDQQEILYGNEAAKLREGQEFLGKKLTELSTLNIHQADFTTIWTQVTTKNHWTGSINYLDQTNKHRTHWLRFVQLKDTPYYAFFFLDTFSLVQTQSEKNKFSYVDHVTNLPNFNQFAYNLNKKISTQPNEKHGIALIRCSNIAQISVLYSSETRRDVTIELARRMLTFLPKNYQVFRLSRDIFAIFASSFPDDVGFQKIVEQVRENLLQPICINQQNIQMHLEMGATCYPSLTTDLGSLLGNAEIALEQHDTTKIIYYSEEITHNFINSLQIVERLKKAIAHNQLEIHYQPLFDHSDQIIAAEALLRWHDDELGYVPPNKITKCAEEHNCVSLLSNWILNRVFQDRLYDQLNVTINLDVAQVEQENFLSKVQSLVTEYQANTTHLTFEITEHQAFEQSEIAIKKLYALREMGFKIALDDFGVGHSALALLSDLPVDILKIDASFITNVEGQSRKGIIARHIVNLAKSLGLVTCCEGIETVKEAKLARLIQANYMQGYLFSKALPLNEFHLFSHTWKKAHE